MPVILAPSDPRKAAVASALFNNQARPEDGRSFLLGDENGGLFLFDTATEVRRLQDNASDKFLEVVTPTDLPALLARIPACRAVVTLLARIPACRAVVTTGQKAADVLAGAFGCPAPPVGGSVGIVIPTAPSPAGFCPNGGISPSVFSPTNGARQLDFYRMPSTSRAYPLPLEKKAEAYRHMFSALGLL